MTAFETRLSSLSSLLHNLMVLGDSNFEFRFRSITPLRSMVDRQEAEFKITVAKYHPCNLGGKKYKSLFDT